MSIVFLKRQDGPDHGESGERFWKKPGLQCTGEQPGKVQGRSALLKTDLGFVFFFFFSSQLAAIVPVYGLGRVSN